MKSFRMKTNFLILFFFVESVSAMAFGRLGQEDHVLVLITIGIEYF